MSQLESSILLCGREFSAQEIRDIQETVKLFPKLSRYELVHTICEHLAWVTPRGDYKEHSCSKALEKLEAMGWLKLPAKLRGRRGKEEIQVGAQTDPAPEIVGSVCDFAPIRLEAVQDRPGIRLWNEYVERYHPLGYKRPFGAHQRYFIWDGGGRCLGGLLFAASAWALAERDSWIGWTPKERAQRLNWVVNNTRFLIFSWVRMRNLASKALSLAAQRIAEDWEKRYGYRPVLLETFVEAGRYAGTCYQAANWMRLGITAGRGRMDRHTRYLSTPKVIFVYPLRADFRSRLCAEGRKEHR